MSQLQALLFDCDGVLAETERDGHRVAFNRAFEYFDLNTYWDVETYGRLLQIGGGKERMVTYWREHGWPTKLLSGNQPAVSSSTTNDDLVTQQLNIAKKIHEKKTELFMEMVRNGEISLRPGILRWIKTAFEKQLQVAICSTSNEKAVQGLVVHLFPDYIATRIPIFAGDQVKEKKPAPDIYELAVMKLGLNKKQCLVIEDSNVGLRAAKAAGLPCVITKSYYTHQEDFSMADAVYNSAEEWSWDSLEKLLLLANHK
ncbi:Haloacid dehalogenase-like hydrolase domain-containing protein At3g48420 [Galdieria sulphuraria]|nr:Haloacid dehalogenase-like hydrolase domain-containing protein At3g48420 [Galdieria sulphuraria]